MLSARRALFKFNLKSLKLQQSTRVIPPLDAHIYNIIGAEISRRGDVTSQPAARAVRVREPMLCGAGRQAGREQGGLAQQQR